MISFISYYSIYGLIGTSFCLQQSPPTCWRYTLQQSNVANFRSLCLKTVGCGIIHQSIYKDCKYPRRYDFQIQLTVRIPPTRWRGLMLSSMTPILLRPTSLTNSTSRLMSTLVGVSAPLHHHRLSSDAPTNLL